MLQYDKTLHYILGQLLTLVLLPFFSVLAVLGIVSVVAALKEYRDYRGYGTPEFLDFIYTVVGSVIILGVYSFGS